MLLDAGLNLTDNDADGSPPLHVVVIHTCMSSVVKRLVVEEGVDVNEKRQGREAPA
jgi:hypothetical protein